MPFTRASHLTTSSWPAKKETPLFSLLVKTERDEVTVLKEEILDAPYPDLTLRITENEQDLTFAYSVDGKSEKILADKVDARILSTDVAGGFVGNTIGLYATSNGEESSTVAAFDYFLYEDDNK